MKFFTKRTAGFTLIELLVVISIIGVLTAVLLANFVGIRGRSKDVAKKSELQELKKALRLYYNDTQQYPGAVSQNVPLTHPSVTATVYMNKTPAEFSYSQELSGDGFCAWATLENTADPDVAASAGRCPVCASKGAYYFVCQD